jgi:2-oxoglutarate ferredoxin oxidoreductase subunit alpha
MNIQAERNFRLMQGNEAVVEGAIAAGVRFFAGYPITPSTEILEEFAVRLLQVGGMFIQLEDELGSLAAVLGASLGGVKAMTATSGPGLALMTENIGLAIVAEIPCVIVDVQRMGPAIGMIFATQGDMMTAKWATPGGNEIIALTPSSVNETYELTIRAVNLSERFRVPVILLSDAYLGHLREKVKVVDYDHVERVGRTKPTVPPSQYLSFDADETGVPAMADIGSEYHLLITPYLHNKAGIYGPSVEERSFLLRRLHNKILAHLDEISMNEEVMLDDAHIAILAYGITARAAKVAVRAARAEGIKVGLFRPITVWPFPREAIAEIAKKVRTIIVVEMNFGQLVGEVERACRGNAEVHLFSQDNGLLITPDKILSAIKEAC